MEITQLYKIHTCNNQTHISLSQEKHVSNMSGAKAKCQCPYQVSTFYTVWNRRNSPNEILKHMVSTTRSNVKWRSHTLPSQCPYQESTPYTVSEIQPGHTFFPARLSIRTPWVKKIPRQPTGCGVKILKAWLIMLSSSFIIYFYICNLGNFPIVY